jgi:hypothetical protein
MEITVMAYFNVLSHYLSVGTMEITKHLIMLTITLNIWWSQLSNLNCKPSISANIEGYVYYNNTHAKETFRKIYDICYQF